MDLGFETIGNATLVCHDREPVLVTDPWITGDAYFGSWTLSHVIPDDVLEAIRKVRFVWVSHGHPDHLSPRSISLLRDKTMLLPDHVGGRIANAFKEQGYDVRILEDRQWTTLSDRIRVLCISDYNQDGILLVDIGGRLVANLNDSSDHGWGRFVKNLIGRYEISFLLRLSGFGDADMINLYDDQGRSIPPYAAHKRPVGREITALLREFGARYFVPFSSMHRYQRRDSIWANAYHTGLSDYAVEFDSRAGELLPAFVRYDCVRDRIDVIEPAENEPVVREPAEFGDDWSQPLEAGDREKISRYFKAISHLEEHLDFIAVRVGGEEHVIPLGKKHFNRGITFEAPRASLMIAIDEEIFDDMLIGNFMKTTLHGDVPPLGLYPDFTPYVAKYADNGLARSKDELAAYFREYRRRAPLGYLRHRLEKRSIAIVRSVVRIDSSFYRLAREAYYLLKRA